MNTKNLYLAIVIVSALAFAGCGGGGGGGGDVGPAPTTTTSTNVTVAQSLTLASSAVSLASVRGAPRWSEYSLQFTGATETYVIFPTPTPVASGDSVTLNFSMTFKKSDLGTAWDNDNRRIKNVTLLRGGQPMVTFGYLSANDQATSTDGTPAATPVVVQITISANGIVSVSIPNGGGQGTSEVTEANMDLYVESIQYSKKTGGTATLTSTVTDVSHPVATFSLYFNTPVASSTTNWSITVANLDNSSEFTLTSANDSALFAVQELAVSGKSILFITVIGNASKKLSANTNYKVTLNSSELTRLDNATKTTAGAVHLGKVIRTFKTAQ